MKYELNGGAFCGRTSGTACPCSPSIGERAARGQPLRDGWVGRDPQLLAGHPDGAAANRGRHSPGGIVAVADRDAAIAVAGSPAGTRPHTRRPEPRRTAAARAGRFGPQAQSPARARLGQRLEVVGAGRRATLGEQHASFVVE